MTDHKYTYKVVENNGGGLTLFVFYGGHVIYAHSGYEFTPGQLTTDLDTLDNGTDIHDWEGCEDDPEAVWLSSASFFGKGCETVVTCGSGKRKLHKAYMGLAAQLEFHVSDEERDMARAASHLGMIGGTAKTESKQSASRANGKLGGRPKKAQ